MVTVTEVAMTSVILLGEFRIIFFSLAEFSFLLASVCISP